MKTIMLVDDEKRLVSLVERYLIREGFRVVTTYNGREWVRGFNPSIAGKAIIGGAVGL